MIKRSAFAAACVAFTVLPAAAVTPPPAPPTLPPSPAPINVTGKWHITDGGTRFSEAPLNLRQVGTTVIGDYASGQGSLSGQLATPRRMDATWSDERGTGWITAYFSDDGRQANGEWGFKGRKPSGRFIGDLVQAGKP